MRKFREALGGRRRKDQDSPSERLDPPTSSQWCAVSFPIAFPDGVEVLHDCPNATVDLCFVHGLTGDRITTWTAQGQSDPWPKTLLSSKLATARILSYGYDAYVVRGSVAGSNRLIDHATNLLNDLTTDRNLHNAASRPIIFVAHSLGGLVCKKAILGSRNNPDAHLRSIFDCTKGVIFMGTPHKGSWMADWAKISAGALGLVKSTNKPLLEILRTDNQLLEAIQVDFWSMIRELRENGRRLEVTCFFEELPLPVVGKVVSKDSATLEGYNLISIRANHRDMVRFSSTNDNGFKRLLGELDRWGSESRTLYVTKEHDRQCLKSLWPTNPENEMVQKFRARDCIQDMRLKQNKSVTSFANAIHEYYAIRATRPQSVHRFDLPLDLTTVPVIENFLGRQDELDKLWQFLQPTKSRSRKVVILNGLGGIGKTQLAIRFARDHQQDFTAIFWLKSNDRSTLLQSLSSFLPRWPGQSSADGAMNDEEIEQRAMHVLKWLAIEGNSRWLIIFDNVDQYSPFSGPVCDAYDIVEFFPGADHGSILITSRLQRLTELGESFPVYKLDLNDTVQLLLQSSSLSMKSKVKGLWSHPDTFALASRLDGLPLAIVIAGAFMRETGTSITEYLQYYEESWSDLQLQSNPNRQYQQGNMLQTWMISHREIQRRDANAAKLLLFLARFYNRDIWYELIKNSNRSSNVPTWLEKSISSGLAFKTGVRSLIGFSLLQPKEQEGGYSMHPVVQDWCIHVANTDKGVDLIQLDELALVSVGYTASGASVGGHSELQQRLISHANYVRHKGCPGHDIAVWGACHGLGDLYSKQGKLLEAEEMYQRALIGLEKAFGPDHTSTLDALHTLGNLYKDQWTLQEAEGIYQRALVGLEKALGPDHTSTLDALHTLGNLYKDQWKLEEAEGMYQRALVGLKKALGPDHTSTLRTSMTSGNSTKTRGSCRRQKECTSEPWDLYKKQGKFPEERMMLLRALGACIEEVRDPDYTSTLDPVIKLGISPRQLWITSNDRSLDDAAGRIGGDSDLSEDGKRYAKALARFVDHQRMQWEFYQATNNLLELFQARPCDSILPNPSYIHRLRNFRIWSSTMKRAVQTVEHFNKGDYDVKEMRMLDELHCGNMEGMTYREALKQYPEVFTYRRKGRLFYRYPGPGGESYLDVINRLRAVISEVQRTTDHVLLVSHRATTRVLLSYFCGLKRNNATDLEVPVGTLYRLERKTGGADFNAYRYNPDTDWFDWIPKDKLPPFCAQ
ncbi:putative Pfs, NB-ARC and TPR domain protein (JCVI) [Aspergillus udagawae]|nr:putative Pfs, NB-ARC and TPR domain protein (JCVI) [Aspergillus udagawae]